MRVAKPEWVAALRGLEGCGEADIQWNELVGRWAFVLPSADNVPRTQFWGWFNQPIDPVTGLHPFRELDDVAMREAIVNLTKTYVANPFDGAGSTRKEVRRRYDWNRDMRQKRYAECGDRFADMAAERGHRLRGSPIIPVRMWGDKT